MIAIRNLKLPLSFTEDMLLPLCAKKLKLPPNAVTECRLLKKSLDARKKDDLHYVCTAAVTLSHGEERLLSKNKNPDISLYTPVVYEIPQVKAPKLRPVIVGFGPAGMFAALVLARAGARPIVLERGCEALRRREKVNALREHGILDPECNVQFGEGGAGTFSDGKLNTGTKDRRLHFVLDEFAAHGAPAHIVWDAKPHIGTDILIDVVQKLRREVISLGGEVRFESKMTRLLLTDGNISGVEINGSEILPCEDVILAIGHSARDTFEVLHAMGVPMEPKPFSMGVRIEHKQSMIDNSQYGENHPKLPAADYSLNVHLPDGTSAYTFCMCPGGEVFAAASELGGVCTNGMSYSRRDGENANAALLVTLHTEDFPDRSVLSGMYWQREIEQRAFRCGGGNYHAPAQTVKDFLNGVPSTGPGAVQPSYRPGVTWTDLHEVLPKRITSVMENALPALGKKLRGFDDGDAVMTAPETRSSSPVRILRNAECCSEISGLYPCGEGAGYAGGISSAAVDGMRCAEAVLKKLL